MNEDGAAIGSSGKPWRIEMLGRLRVLRGGREIPGFPNPKPGKILAYLAYYSGQEHPRERLMDLFWPDVDPDHARDSLRVAIRALRQEMEPTDYSLGDVIRASRAAIQLNTDVCETDVAEYEAAVASAGRARDPEEKIARYTRVVELYRGELLPGHYEDWIRPEQERLSRSYREALGQLVRLFSDRGVFDRALAYANDAIRADPLNERAHCDLIRLYAAMGLVSAIPRVYAELERRLHQELSLASSPEVRELARTLCSGGVRGSASFSHVGDPGKPPLSMDDIENTPALPVGDVENAPPLPLSRFFGREEEIKRLEDWVFASPLSPETDRLITVTGPGGIGKTHLVLELLRRVRGKSEGQVWYINLLDVDNADRIGETIRQSIGLVGWPGADPLDALARGLAEGPSLLVLDNFEKLVDDGRWVVDRILQRMPSVRCLVTSRRSLSLPGEREYSLAPLPLPEDGDRLEELRSCPSIGLFLDRARLARSDFWLNADNAGDIVSICHQLEGMPLAIELVAANAGVLTTAQMAEQFRGRLRVEPTERAARDPRHHSLRQVMEWSWRRLDLPTRSFFTSLTVFRGGWTVEAATVVCRTPAALGSLIKLQRDSLLFCEPEGDEMRCRMLESIREFGAEQLPDSDRTALNQQHGAYYLGLVENAEKGLKGPHSPKALQCLDLEQANVAAARERAASRGDREMELRILGALCWYWWLSGQTGQMRELLMDALQHPESKRWPAARAKAFSGAARLAWDQGEYEHARDLVQESLGYYQRSGDRGAIAAEMHLLANIQADQGEIQMARDNLERALAIQRDLGNEWETARLLNKLGSLSPAETREEGRQLILEALGIFRSLGDVRGIAAAAHSLAGIHQRRGEYRIAQNYLEESAAGFRAIGEKRGVAASLLQLGLALRSQRSAGAARPVLAEALKLFREIGHKQGVDMTAAAVINLEGALSMKSVGPLMSAVKPRARRCGLEVRAGL